MRCTGLITAGSKHVFTSQARKNLCCCKLVNEVRTRGQKLNVSFTDSSVALFLFPGPAEHKVGKLVVEIAWLLGPVVVGFCTRKER